MNVASPRRHRNRRAWLIGGSAMVVVWGLAFVAMAVARSGNMTAEKVRAYVEANPIVEGQSPQERRRVIDGLAHRVNRLPYSERRQLQIDRSLEHLRDRLTEQEQVHLLQQTLPRGMQQMMEAFNEMPRDRRQQLVQEAMLELDRARTESGRAGDRAGRLDDTASTLVIDEGLKAFFTHASASAKLDLQPLIEQIQRQLQKPHRPRATPSPPAGGTP